MNYESSSPADICYDNYRVASGYHWGLDAARRGPTRSSYDGEWSVAIYITRRLWGCSCCFTDLGSRVYSVDQNYQAYGAVSSRGAVRVTVVRATSRLRLGPHAQIPGAVDGVRSGASALALVGHAAPRLLLINRALCQTHSRMASPPRLASITDASLRISRRSGARGESDA